MYPVGQKFSRKHSILHGLGDTSNFKFYHICQKFKMAAIFGRRKILRIEQRILHIYSVSQKFSRNRSILHGLGDTSHFKCYHFCQKFKMAAIFEKRKNFEN